MRVENSVFGPEIIAMRFSLETVQGITTYELRMMGVPLNTPTYIYGDNMSFIVYIGLNLHLTRKKIQSAITL